MRSAFSGAGTNWSARRTDAYQRQFRDQRGPWGPPAVGVRSLSGFVDEPRNLPGFAGANTETEIDSIVAVIVHDFREHGMKAGMREAAKWGVSAGARLYVAIRAESEEQIAGRLAAVNARLAHEPNARALIIDKCFLKARLTQMRAALKEGATPPQSVVDRPEIPRRELPRWLAYGAFFVSVVALLAPRGGNRA